MSIDKILEYVKRTNPTMTKEKLIEELSKNRYSSVALVMVLQNIRQEK
jgi:soluble P-type ATPase